MSNSHPLMPVLWPTGDQPTDAQVYAVLDGASDGRIEPAIQSTGLEHACLFAGPLSPALQSASPWLVHLAPTAALTLDIFRQGWGRHWGIILIVAPHVTLQALRRHLRTLLRVADADGRALLFRFYDPRVLRIYLPTCTPAEGRQLFGPVDAIVCEHEGAAGFVRYTCSRRGVSVEPRIFSQAYTAADAPGALLAQAPWIEVGLAKAPAGPLVIRREQMAVFEGIARTRFDRFLLAHVRGSRYPSPVALDDVALVAMLRRVVADAHAAGLRTAADVTDYVDLAMLLGPDWLSDARIPWAGSLFQRDDLDGECKLRVARQIVRAGQLDASGLPWGQL